LATRARPVDRCVQRATMAPMHVSCPSCGTTYRVPAPFRRRRRPTFECTGCGHVFEPEPSEPDWDDEEPFVMDDADAEERGIVPSDDLADDEDAFEVDDQESREGDDEGESDQVEDDDEDDEPAPRRKQRKPRAPRGRTSARQPPSPKRFALRCLLAVVLVYGVLGIYISTFPDASRVAMARIPLVGPSLARAPLGPGQMGISDVSATLQPLAGGKDEAPALVVTATVTNHAAVTAEQIDLRIEMDATEPRSEQRTCTGTTLNVTSFKRGELELMAGYNRSRVAHIAPGESATCQSVFLTYPSDLRSVRVRVASAHGR
jgi:hypothetical protein